MREQDRKLEWKDLKMLVAEETDLAVRIQQGLGSGRPQYSIEIGRVGRDRKFLRYMRMQYTTANGKVTVEAFEAGVLAGLLERARLFVEDHQQQREAAWLAQRQAGRDADNDPRQRGSVAAKRSSKAGGWN